jgi:hypothetical protein
VREEQNDEKYGLRLRAGARTCLDITKACAVRPRKRKLPNGIFTAGLKSRPLEFRCCAGSRGEVEIEETAISVWVTHEKEGTEGAKVLAGREVGKSGKMREAWRLRNPL